MNETRALSIDIGTKNLAYCVIDMRGGDDPRLRVEGWGVVDIAAGGGRRSGNDTVAACIAALQRIPQCDTVLVENQPALKNPLMKAVQACVQTFYTLRGCRVTVCSPRQKTASAMAYLGSRDPAAHRAVRQMGLDRRRAEKACTVAATAYAMASLGHPHGRGVSDERGPGPTRDEPPARASRCPDVPPMALEVSPEAAASFLGAAKKDDMADSLWQGVVYGMGAAGLRPS